MDRKGLIVRAAALAAMVCVILLGVTFVEAKACPPVAVSAFSVSAFAVPTVQSVQVQALTNPVCTAQAVVQAVPLAVAQPVVQQAVVQTVAFPVVQQQAVILQQHVGAAAVLGVRNARSRSVTIQRTSTGCGVLGLRCR